MKRAFVLLATVCFALMVRGQDISCSSTFVKGHLTSRCTSGDHETVIECSGNYSSNHCTLSRHLSEDAVKAMYAAIEREMKEHALEVEHTCQAFLPLWKQSDVIPPECAEFYENNHIKIDYDQLPLTRNSKDEANMHLCAEGFFADGKVFCSELTDRVCRKHYSYLLTDDERGYCKKVSNLGIPVKVNIDSGGKPNGVPERR